LSGSETARSKQKNHSRLLDWSWRKFQIPRRKESLRKEGPEGAKRELGFTYFSTGKMGFETLGHGIGDWDWEKSSI